MDKKRGSKVADLITGINKNNSGSSFKQENRNSCQDNYLKEENIQIKKLNK